MFENDGELPYKKKAKKKSTEKSDHKHEYDEKDLEGEPEWYWFDKIKVCRICGKRGDKFKA